ncbi:tetraacyldisaccharide 4'-kinase [Terrimonas pollutisoli]|uniref:tetraacyldisaccharide 4'-kinase n=1 Tax=Terrimonas pollutisoli TaxID=3034147 RepID=UPI0023EDD2AC|nr:tetraacyldisaccharide 4'-kinase [Terrimonas sp. H1YJ31]
MFSNFFLKSFRILLLPFALIYWLVIAVRNWMYNKKLLRSTSFGLPLICVGNLSVGGTGKSPMVEWLIRLLKDQFKIATLSRGYKRRTKGYALANERSTALDIGDEPMQFHHKFPDVPVAVGEERLVAIPQLLHDRPETEVIILDDAFQHRAISAGLNIILTEYSNLFTRDFYLPTGDLRDLKSEYKRAHIIVVTKCSPELTLPEKQKIIDEIKPVEGQSIFFAAMEYGQPYHILNKTGFYFMESTEVLLVTGIANPRPLKSMLEKHSKTYHMLQYADHRIFTIDDLKEIRKKFAAVEAVDKIILTTEKDAVRLEKFNAEIADLPLFVIPVRHHFLFDEEKRFGELVIDFIRNTRAAKN